MQNLRHICILLYQLNLRLSTVRTREPSPCPYHKKRNPKVPIFKKDEQFCKPGSVSDGHLSGTCVAAGLKPLVGKPSRPSLPRVAPGGVYTGLQSPSSLCALTAHFHTYPRKRRRLFSVALSLESLPPAVSRHPCSMEPGLSSGEKSPATV